MKKLALLAALLGSAVLLSNCTADQNAQTAAEIAQVQSTATQICSFVPDAAAVAGMIGMFVPQVGSALPIAGQIASAICSALTNVKAGAGRVGAAAPVLAQDAIGQRFAVTGHFVSAAHRRR